MFDEDRPYRDIVAAASRDGLQYQGVSHVINLAGATNFFDEDDSGCSARPQHVQPPHTTGYVIPPVTRPSSTTHTASPSATPHAPSVRTVRAWGGGGAADELAASMCSPSFEPLPRCLVSEAAAAETRGA